MIAGRIFDLPLPDAVAGESLSKLFPLSRLGMGAEVHCAEVEALGTEHRAVVRAPFGEMEDMIKTESKIALDFLLRLRVNHAARADAHVRTGVGRHDKEVRDGRNPVAI